MRNFLVTCTILVAAIAVAASSSATDSWVEVGSRASVETDLLDQFGSAAALDGSTLVVGAPQKGSWGEAHLFELVPSLGLWREVQTLAGSVVEDLDFGSALAIAGGVVAARALTATGSAVYLFERGGGEEGAWGEVLRLELDDVGPIALSADTLAAGVPSAEVAGRAQAGAVELYRRSTGGGWGYLGRLTAAGGQAGDRFGTALGASGERLLVGASAVAELGLEAGAAYLFARDGAGVWSETAKLLAGDGDAGDRFGAAVALDGDTALVGAAGDEALGEGAGAAYLFVRQGDGTWGQRAKLLAADGGAGDGFGSVVTVAGEVAVVGAPAHDEGGIVDEGAAYVFERDEGGPGAWGQAAKLVGAAPDPPGRFGTSLAANGETIFAGFPGDEYRGGQAGAIAQFERTPWHQGQICVQPLGFCDALELDVKGKSITGYWRNIDCEGTDLPVVGVIRDDLPLACLEGDQDPVRWGIACKPSFGCWVIGWGWYFMFDGSDHTYDLASDVGDDEPPGACGLDDHPYAVREGPCPAQPLSGGIPSTSAARAAVGGAGGPLGSRPAGPPASSPW